MTVATSVLNKLSNLCAAHDITLTREETEIIRLAFNLSPYPEYKSWDLLSDCAISSETYTWTKIELCDKLSTVLDIIFKS